MNRFLILLSAISILFSCQNPHGIVKIDDEKTKIIQKVFENVAKEDNTFLQEVFDQSMIMINSKEDTLSREAFFSGIEKIYENFDEISFDEITVGSLNEDAEGPGVETNYYKNGMVWTQIWSTFRAKGKHTGKEISFPFHICYKWEGDKIIEEYQYFDTTLFEQEMNAGPDSDVNELISVVLMSVNNKTTAEINKFCQYYQNRVNQLEPDVFCWKFFRTGKNSVTLIERYKNEAASLNHIKNISPGGEMEKDFGPFINHFKLESIDYYGNTTESFRKVVLGFGFKTNFYKTIAGFSL